MHTCHVKPTILSISADGTLSCELVREGTCIIEVDYAIHDSVDVSTYSINEKARELFLSSVGNDFLKCTLAQWHLKGEMTSTFIMEPFSSEEIMSFAAPNLPTNVFVPREILTILYGVWGGSGRLVRKTVWDLIRAWKRQIVLREASKEVYSVLKEWFQFAENEKILQDTIIPVYNQQQQQQQQQQHQIDWNEVSTTKLFEIGLR